MVDQNSSMVAQTAEDQGIDMLPVFTSDGVQKGNKRRLNRIDLKHALLSHARVNIKMGRKKEKGRRTSVTSIGRNRKIDVSLPLRMVFPSKRARQPMILDLVIDTDLFQAFKRWK